MRMGFFLTIPRPESSRITLLTLKRSRLIGLLFLLCGRKEYYEEKQKSD
jgi:hypothetical protein